MNNKKIMKLEMLRRKINEYFEKNPNVKGFILKAKIGEGKVHWKITKEGNSYNIIEVNSNTNKYIIEQKMEEAETSTFGSPRGFELDKEPEKSTVRHPESQAFKGVDYSPEGVKANMKKMSEPQFGKAYGIPKRNVFQSMQTFPKGGPEGQKDVLDAIIAQSKTMPDRDFQKKFGKPKQFFIKQDENELRQRLKKQRGNPVKFLHTMPPMPKEGKLNEASTEFANISRDFVASMTPPFSHTKISSALKNANTTIGKLQDPNERQQVGSMIGVLTSLADSTTNQMTAGKPTIRLQSKKYKGGKIAEAGKDKEEEIPKPKDVSKGDPKEKPIVKKTDDQTKKDEPQGIEKQEPKPEQPEPQKEKQVELNMFNDALKGQVISSANIVPTPNGANVELILQGMTSPVQVQIDGQKISYNYKGRPIFVRR